MYQLHKALEMLRKQYVLIENNLEGETMIHEYTRKQK